MNSFLRSCLRGTLRGLLRLVGGFLLLAALVVFVVWSQNRQTSQEKWKDDAARARAEGRISYYNAPLQAEFSKLIQELYDVESVHFLDAGSLRVVFSPVADEAEQGTCQAIANLWSWKNPQPEILVESYHGQTRTAWATVINGHTINPPPPTGRRSTAGKAAAKAAALEAFAKTPEGKEQITRIDQTEERIKRLLDLRQQLEGKPYASVVAAYGEPQSKDTATGWATWKDFKALFKTGKVEVVEAIHEANSLQAP